MDLLLEGEELLDAGTVRHILEMGHAVGKFGEIEIELGGATAAPEEMGVRRRKMIEKGFSSGQHPVGDTKCFA